MLSYDEWAYLRYERQRYDEKVGLATITGIGGNDGARGVVLLPDSRTLPPGLTFYSGCGNGWATNSYVPSQWQLMEAAGAVFLSVAGQGANNCTIANVGAEGHYWSSTLDDSQAYAVYSVGFHCS